MSDFDGRPFVAGTITGIRSFRIDPLGRLTGVRQQRVWSPGTNVGRCHKGETTVWGSLFGSFRISNAASDPVDMEKHRIGQIGCSCGYYAYFDNGHNPHHLEGNAVGIVEGFGLVTVGERGFRAEKARLVGLVDERSWLSRTPLSWYGWIAAAMWLAVVALVVTFSALPALVPILVPLAGPAACGASLFTVTKSSRLKRAPRSRVPARTAKFYGVPVYRSVKAALKAHPLTPPQPASPENDEQFWTRSAA